MAALHRIHPGDDVAECLARAAWTVIAEPGDAAAGALIEALGPEDALAVALGAGLQSSEWSATGRASRVLAEGRARWRPRARGDALRQAIRGADEVGARLLTPGDEHWPASLDDLGPHTPIALWVRGDASALSCAPRVSVVGARAATGYGEQVAAELAGDLASAGVVIVSGGAYGIDGAAHRAALGVQGTTVAFLAGGVDRAYPIGHRRLLQQITRDGAVVSEPPCGTAPTKWRFLARNRLIAALGQATVVVEAGWRSGSLNTAGHAASLGRPLGAVPGPVTSASSAGCHRLFREYDAQCVTSAREVRELWAPVGVETSDTADAARHPDRARVLDAMGARSRVSVEEIARRSGMSPDRVRSLLGLLHLEGDVALDEVGWHRARSASGS
ncbi:DNA-processing protein DprA [Microbacterium sp. Se5.02b]|uniref:DNA-processing protein DprA n=1 Tax=Microbacterium sp. Se5.02b TaxID=2864103 RepID=UPI00215D7208|nr:DNA-processing protein DprA [Microbacterium sp. Se5.02b]